MSPPGLASGLFSTLGAWFRRRRVAPTRPAEPKRPARDHVLVIDGTQSRFNDGEETNAGLLFKLLREAADPERVTLWYHPGIQGHGFWNWVTIASGWGINQLILDGYTQLARNWRPGDRIFLFGFSRGAYAVRSIAGMIGLVGLVRQTSANADTLAFAFRLYETRPAEAAIRAFQNLHCHTRVPIEMIGVWDTVKALGLPYPLLTYLAPMATEFHDHNIGRGVKAGYHALALDEDRLAYRPVMWQTEPGWDGHLEQVWFRGAHGDVGGHVWATPEARPLSNIPLVWMASKAQHHGLALPRRWYERFPQDPYAPMQGSRSGIGRFFLLRQPRPHGLFPGEAIHETARPFCDDPNLRDVARTVIDEPASATEQQ